MYTIEYAEDVSEDIINLRAYERKQILSSIERKLRYEPTKETRNRKPLIGLIPPWDHLETPFGNCVSVIIVFSMM